MHAAWIGGFVLAAGTAMIFAGIRKRGVGFKATQSSLGVSEDSKDIKDPKRSGKSQVKVYLELNL